MEDKWLKGRIIAHDGRVFQEYLCYRCGQACRVEIFIRDQAPQSCANPDRYKYFEELRKKVNILFPKTLPEV